MPIIRSAVNCDDKNKLTPKERTLPMTLNSPRLAVVLPTWPNRLVVGSQKMRSKHRITLFRFPKPSRLMASCFHVGSGGSNLTVFNWFEGSGAMATFRTPRVKVLSTRSAAGKIERKRWGRLVQFLILLISLMKSNICRQFYGMRFILFLKAHSVLVYTTRCHPRTIFILLSGPTTAAGI